MTLYHFGNCVALIYAPYHMVYKYSGISEYASFSKCVYAGFLYILTQLCKMLLLATFFPDSDHQAGGEYDIFMELVKATVDFADYIGIYFALNAVPGKGHAKILTVALGWASAEVLLTRSVPLWTEARGAEFSWSHVLGALMAGECLIQAGALAAAGWLASRRVHPTGLIPLLLLLPTRPLLEALLAKSLALTAWGLLALKATLASGLALTALAMYATVQQ